MKVQYQIKLGGQVGVVNSLYTKVIYYMNLIYYTSCLEQVRKEGLLDIDVSRLVTSQLKEFNRCSQTTKGRNFRIANLGIVFRDYVHTSYMCVSLCVCVLSVVLSVYVENVARYSDQFCSGSSRSSSIVAFAVTVLLPTILDD